MGSHPLNLALRFILELVALFSFGYWGWLQSVGGIRFVWAVGLPVLAAVVWGVFAVPNDPSRSGEAPVPIAGRLRLVLEGAIFLGAVTALCSTGAIASSVVLGVIVLGHYLFSYDRVLWLLQKDSI